MPSGWGEYKTPGEMGAGGEAGGRMGIYGHTPGGAPSGMTVPTSDGFRDKGALLAPETHMLPSFGLEWRRQRNINRTRGVFRTNISPCFRHADTPSGSGMKSVQAYNAPSYQAWLHQAAHPERKPWMQDARQIVQANRNSQNAGKSARIRPAAPQQVAWKVPYVVGQRNVQPIGPYQSLAQRSILYRISGYLSSLGGGSNG